MHNKDNKTLRGKGAIGSAKTSGHQTRAGGNAFPESGLCASLPIKQWHPLLDTGVQNDASLALEQGRVLVLPQLDFSLAQAEATFLRPDCLAPRARCVRLGNRGLEGLAQKEIHAPVLEKLLERYAQSTQDLIARLLPAYVPHLTCAHTAFWPAELAEGGRSYRHGERLLHIDTDARKPLGSARRLRIFTNIHPEGLPQVWRFGESFASLAARFLPRLRMPLPGSAWAARLLARTRGLRQPYDHYMLQLHNLMKRDGWYQAEGPQEALSFASGSSWMLFSDQVPYAAMSGQHMLEQTFIIDPQGLYYPAISPQATLEKLMRRKLA